MTPFVGQLQAFGFNFAPRGWAKCEGQILAIVQYQALFSLLGTTFGGDGRTTFGLPDLRGRSIVGDGNGPGLGVVKWGQKGGAETHTLTTAQLPAHNHDVKVGVNTAIGDEATPTAVLAGTANGFAEEATAGAVLGGVSQINVGTGQSFNMRNPYLGINVCIALDGVYPSRN